MDIEPRDSFATRQKASRNPEFLWTVVWDFEEKERPCEQGLSWVGKVTLTHYACGKRLSKRDIVMC